MPNNSDLVSTFRPQRPSAANSNNKNIQTQQTQQPNQTQEIEPTTTTTNLLSEASNSTLTSDSLYRLDTRISGLASQIVVQQTNQQTLFTQQQNQLNQLMETVKTLAQLQSHNNQESANNSNVGQES